MILYNFAENFDNCRLVSYILYNISDILSSGINKFRKIFNICGIFLNFRGKLYSRGDSMKLNMTYEQYERMYKRASKNSASAVNVLKAFLIGGSICTVGQALLKAYSGLGLEEKDAGTAVSITLILASVLLTALGIYDRIAKHGGAGTLVPITGFANAVAAPAVEFKTEGYVTGVGVKIFTIAGPVILYGTLASAAVGAVRYLIDSLF